MSKPITCHCNRHDFWSTVHMNCPFCRCDILRDALCDINNIKHQMHGGDWDEIEEAQEIASRALNTK